MCRFEHCSGTCLVCPLMATVYWTPLLPHTGLRITCLFVAFAISSFDAVYLFTHSTLIIGNSAIALYDVVYMRSHGMPVNGLNHLPITAVFRLNCCRMLAFAWYIHKWYLLSPHLMPFSGARGVVSELQPFCPYVCS